MIDKGIEELRDLLAGCREAAKFAWDHYGELAMRQATYTLYGPYAYDIGAGNPSNLTPKTARKLTNNTRRKHYLIYELDENYGILRTVHMRDFTRVECIYHHFALNGISYAYPFSGKDKTTYDDKVVAIKFSAGKPVYFGLGRNNFLFAQFYEHVSLEKMCVSTYRYWSTAKLTQSGHPVDIHAPIGAVNSPVQRHYSEEVSYFVDFSQWFR